MLRSLLAVLLTTPLLSTAMAHEPVALLDDEEEDLFDDDDLLGETEEERAARLAEEQRRLDEADDLGAEDIDLDSLDDLDMEGPVEDLLDDEDIEPDRIGGEGEDTARLYRAQLAMVKGYIPDEEMIAWEEYLAKYPRSLFRDRIETRMDELEAKLYDSHISRDAPVRLDADQREIRFAQALLLETLNPRTRLQGGFEWGLPNYMNLFLDYEHQLRRQLSAHVGARRRYTGWSVEPGVRWAFVKSSRTQTIVALIGDLHVNTDPFFVGLRPQLGVGKKFGNVDAQLQAGVDLDTRAPDEPRLVGGANLTYHASDYVAGFLETSVHMKNLAWADGGSFRFNTASFGMKFYPRVAGVDHGAIEINAGASVPYTANYWMFHFGSIMAQFNYYL